MSAHNAERRLLLSEDHERQVWLDLDTGEQVEVPLEGTAEDEPASPEGGDPANDSPGPIMAVVLATLDEMRFRYQLLESNDVWFAVGQFNLMSSTRVLVDEENRSVRVVSRLPLQVPEPRRAAVCEAAMRFMCARTWATVMMNPDNGEVQVSQSLLLADVTPTTALVRRTLMNVLWPLDVLHPVLVAVAHGVAEPGDTEALAERFDGKG